MGDAGEMPFSNGSTGKSMKTERDRFVAFAFAAADLLLEVNDDMSILFASGAASRLGLSSADDFVGRSFLEFVPPGERRFLSFTVKSIVVGQKSDPVAIRIRTATGGNLRAVLGGCRLPTDKSKSYITLSFLDPTLVAAIGGGHDDPAIVENRIADRLRRSISEGVEARMTYLSLDGLSEARAGGDSPGIAVFMDALDEYLASVSVGQDAAGSIGGDRFAVMHDKAVEGEAIEARVSEITKASGPEGVSVGRVTIDLDTGGLEEEDAVRALLYAMRKFSSDGIEKFDLPNLKQAAQSMMSRTVPKIVEVRAVIEDRMVEIALQPIVEIPDARLHHFEALARLPNGTSIQDFVVFAEETGLIEEFDLAVVDQVLQGLKMEWDRGWKPKVAVNLSARSIDGENFFAKLERTMRPYKEVLPQLIFELTETVKINDFERANAKLQILRKAGHKVCLDDIGAGGTSFRSLETLQIDFAKIDGALFDRASREGDRRVIIDGIVQICQSRKIDMIAEAIESERHESFAIDLGIHYGQGWRYGRPSMEITGSWR